MQLSEIHKPKNDRNHKDTYTFIHNGFRLNTYTFITMSKEFVFVILLWNILW